MSLNFVGPTYTHDGRVSVYTARGQESDYRVEIDTEARASKRKFGTRRWIDKPYPVSNLCEAAYICSIDNDMMTLLASD